MTVAFLKGEKSRSNHQKALETPMQIFSYARDKSDS